MNKPQPQTARRLSRKNAYRPQAELVAESRRNEILAGEHVRDARRSLLRRIGSCLLMPQWVAGAVGVGFHVLIARATAAQIRHFPDNTKLGRIRFGQFPDATLNGKAIRLGAGARIHNQENLIVTPASLHGKTYVVGYVTGALDEIVTVWILSEDEYRALRKKRR